MTHTRETKTYKDKPSQKGKDIQIQRKTHKGTANEEKGGILTLSQFGRKLLKSQTHRQHKNIQRQKQNTHNSEIRPHIVRRVMTSI